MTKIDIHLQISNRNYFIYRKFHNIEIYTISSSFFRKLLSRIDDVNAQFEFIKKNSPNKKKFLNTYKLSVIDSLAT